MRYLPFAIRKYIEAKHNTDEQVRSVKVKLVDGREKRLLELTRWELLNCSNDQVIELYQKVFRLVHQVEEGEEIDSLSFSEYRAEVSAYTIGKMGILGVYTELAKIPDQ